MKLVTEKTQITGVFLAVIGIAAIIIISFRQSQRLEDASVWVRHTRQVLTQTQDVQAASTHFELSVKNFLLMEDSSLLDTIRTSISFLHTAIDTLKALVSDNPVQQARTDSLRNFVGQRMTLLDNAVQIRLTRGLDAALVLLRSVDEKRYSAEVQFTIGELQQEENRLLLQRRDNNRNAVTRLQEILVGVIIILAILVLAVFRNVRAGLVREKKAREQLSHFNRDLEKKVKEKTAGLTASQEKYRTLFYKSPLPKWIYDSDTLRFLEVNDAAVAAYGYSQEEFFQMTIRDIRPKEDVSNLLLNVGQIKSAPDESRHGFWRHIKKSGEIISVEVTAHSIEYNDRKARIVVVNDVTEQKKAEVLLNRLNEDLAKRADELSASNAELERFAYIASHDLQEPLRMVASFVQLLEKKYKAQLDEKADQYIHFAIDGTERMKTLILDLLEYSKVGSAEKNFEAVDTSGIAEEVTTLFRAKIVAARATIELDALPVIRADRVQLTQLFQNLIGNALKYRGQEPPVIRISAKEDARYWEFAVADNGIGIDPSYFEKIFIIFQRLHNKTEYSGTGIGLAICRKIADRHGGRIWVESEQGKGSTFFFSINKHQ